MDKIIIDVGKQSDGRTFRLNPKSSMAFKKEFPNLNPLSTVFISHDNQYDFEDRYGNIYIHIIQLLTDLPFDEIHKLKISIVDPVTKKEYFNTDSVHV